MNTNASVIAITGSMGSGKTTVMAEASDLLTASKILHAAIDLDALGVGHLAQEAWDYIAYQNLAAVWANYAAAGIERLLIAGAIETDAELARIRDAVSGANIVVCRLRASLATMQARVRVREPGISQMQLLARVGELDTILDRAGLEDFAIVNENASVTEVARRMLCQAGWLPR